MTRPLWLLPLALLPACGRDPAPQTPALPVEPALERVSPALPAPGSAAAEAAQHWITYQYLLNTPEQAPAMIGAYVDAGRHTLNPDANALEMLSVFLARLAAAHPDQLDAWTAAATDLPPDAQFLFAYAAWAGDPDNAEPRVRRITAAMPPDDPRLGGLLALSGQQPPDLAAVAPESTAALDLWWTAFMADGDTRWVDLVLTAVPPPGVSREESGFTNPGKVEIARAAVWSLASNAFQHPRVLAHLRARRAAEPAAWPELDAVLANAEQALRSRPSPAPVD